jgi:multiple sugar transport system substrate-binding protein
MKLSRVILIFLFLGSAGCDRLPFGNTATAPAASPTEAVSPTSQATFTPQVTDTPSGPVTLRVWLPPQFDPASGTRGGILLKARLDEFIKRRPGVRLDVRIKALDGPGGMLESLSTASAAAPEVIPDLIALPRPILESAALKGLLHPFDGLTTVLDEPDWYNYARELARLQNSTYGIPFAGDALVLMYRPSLVKDPPRDWNEALKSTGPIAFPAADPQAFSTLALYQSAGGKVQDDQGRPALDAPTLSRVLMFYQQADAAGLLLPNLDQIELDEGVWKTYTEGQSNQMITWASHYLQHLNALPVQNEPASITATPQGTTTPQKAPLDEFSAAPLPTPDGNRYTLATGWVWALGSHHPEQQALSVQLAEFVTQSDFLAQWTLAEGYLPPRSGALSAWDNSTAQLFAGQIVNSSHLSPASDVLSSLSPILRDAIQGILEKKGDPLSLAQEAVARLANP